MDSGWFEGSVLLLSFIIGWAISVETRIAGRMTRKEHWELCNNRNKQIADQLNRMEQEAREHRERIEKRIDKIDDILQFIIRGQSKP